MGQLFFCNSAGIAWVRLGGQRDRAFIGWKGVKAYQAVVPRDAFGGDPHDRDYTNLPPREFFDVATFDFIVRWPDVIAMRTVDPWPRFEIEWGGRGFTDRTLFAPELRFGILPFTPTPERRERFGRAVEEVFEAAPRYMPPGRVSIDRGWLDVDDVRWSAADRMPTAATGGPSMGAFRTAESNAGVIADRRPPTAAETLLLWLASSPDRPLRATPREVALTHDEVYARFYDGTVRHVPRSALRVRLGAHDSDAVYVFGRRTSLVLTHRENCPVRAALDRQLER